MVRGLFPRSEQEAVLDAVARSVVFLTNKNIEKAILSESFDESAWRIANLYLASRGAELLGDSEHLVGISQELTCYVSPEYFTQDDPFADFVVHEVAHIFHNCKRSSIGLKETRNKEWLLDIEYAKRETFAYSCEAYSRIVGLGKTPAARRSPAEQYAESERIPDERVDPLEVAALIQQAAAARNGWKAILAHCAPPRKS